MLEDQGKELEQMQQLAQQQKQQLQEAHFASSDKEAAAASAAQLRCLPCTCQDTPYELLCMLLALQVSGDTDSAAQMLLVALHP